jgi:hypothetical protein
MDGDRRQSGILPVLVIFKNREAALCTYLPEMSFFELCQPMLHFNRK